MSALTSSAASGGFVRFPKAWLTLPLSPGAKCLLVHFCGAASVDGESWYSFAQLGEIVQRSRSSISGYVAELRDAGLVETERQRTANGFNYRLRVRLVRWREIHSGWAASRAGSRVRAMPGSKEVHGRTRHAESLGARAERRVRPAERKNPSGSINQIHKTQDTEGSRSNIVQTNHCKNTNNGVSNLNFDKDLELEWRKCQIHENDRYFDRRPSRRLLEAVIAHVEALKSEAGFLAPEDALEEARRGLTRFGARRGLPQDDTAVAKLAETLVRRLRTRSGIARALMRLDAEWATRWRRWSTPEQLDRWLLDQAGSAALRFEDLGKLWRFQNRALLARQELLRRERAATRGRAADRAADDVSSRETTVFAALARSWSSKSETVNLAPYYRQNTDPLDKTARYEDFQGCSHG